MQKILYGKRKIFKISPEERLRRSSVLKSLRNSLTPEQEKRRLSNRSKTLKRNGTFALDRNPMWRDGMKMDKGYVYVTKKDHPNAYKQGYVFEHRLVMEIYLGRYLETWEHIHHKNGIKHDNRIENLAIVNTRPHYGEVRCPHCLKEFLIR